MAWRWKNNFSWKRNSRQRKLAFFTLIHAFKRRLSLSCHFFRVMEWNETVKILIFFSLRVVERNGQQVNWWHEMKNKLYIFHFVSWNETVRKIIDDTKWKSSQFFFTLCRRRSMFWSCIRKTCWNLSLAILGRSLSNHTTRRFIGKIELFTISSLFWNWYNC
jgi:hypothetical protein